MILVGGGAFNVAHTIKQMIKSGAAAVHMEDQVAAKRCGHRPKKQLVSSDEMVDRVKSAVAAKTDPDFYIIARTDAAASEGLSAAIDRANAYIAAGADAIFAEALTELEHFQQFCQEVDAPVLANLTEFGKTPYFTVEQMRSVGVRMILYPWAATRAMNQAALQVYQTVREQGTQQNEVDRMQTRDELYQFLGYYDYERRLDEVLGKE